MKLRTKIQISFSITMAILLIIIGMVTQKLNTATVNTLTDNSIATSATLASNHISQQLEDYLILTLNKALDKAGAINEAELAAAAKDGMPNIPGMDLFK